MKNKDTFIKAVFKDDLVQATSLEISAHVGVPLVDVEHTAVRMFKSQGVDGRLYKSAKFSYYILPNRFARLLINMLLEERFS